MTLRYCRSNGYGTIDTNGEEFQLGRKLFEAQVVLTKVIKAKEAGEAFSVEDQDKLIEVAKWFCGLVSTVGHLRADYSTLQMCLHDPFITQLQKLMDSYPRYVYVNDGPPKKEDLAH
jgi:hypothetical protein